MLHQQTWFHSAQLLHRILWFTLALCYIVYIGYQQTHDSWSLLRPLIHEVYLWILASLSHSLCQSQFLMPAKIYNLIRLCLGTAYTLNSFATSVSLSHSTPLLHQAEWFTHFVCYIWGRGSFLYRATSFHRIHSCIRLHLDTWFRNFYDFWNHCPRVHPF